MRKIIIGIIILLSVLSLSYTARGGTLAKDSLRMEHIQARLDDLVETDPAYGQEVDISIGRISLPEILRNVAKISDVSLSVKGGDEIMVSCNFSRAKITDLLYFLCREYDLELETIGNIVSIYPVSPTPPPPKEIDVKYDSVGMKLSYNLNNDNIVDAVRKITNLTALNVVIPPALYNSKVSGYIEDVPVREAVEVLLEINGLNFDTGDNGIIMVSNPAEDASGSSFTRGRRFSQDELFVDSLGMITARINRGDLEAMIVELCEQKRLNYFFLTPMHQETSIFIRDVDLETMLDVILSGTNATYYVENGIYVFGESNKESDLAAVKIVKLNYRSVSKIEEIVPPNIKAGLHIQAFPDLNSIIISGNKKQVRRAVNFISEVDKRVPLVTIEIIIADVKKTSIKEAGINFGIGNTPSKTSGTLSPGVGINLNSQSINNLINSFNGFGSVNLGKVTPEFYLSLKFLEDDGKLTMRSTPKLSTLNGHEATLKSGETKYYKEVTNTYVGYQNPLQTEGYVWKSIDANMIIKIVPFVSSDNHITLDIEIEQTEFTAQDVPEAPPGTATRSFKSIIKVQNEEMVLLGGIDRNSMERSAKGLPFIAKIPILRWIFGSSTNNKIDHKLNVFIKPTITE